MGGSNTRKIVELKRIDWSEKAEKHLSVVAQTDPTISGIDFWKELHDAGKTKLFGVFINGEHKASMLCAVMAGNQEAEFVVELIGGDDGHAGVMDGLPGIDELAKQAGCNHIRVMTMRKGMVKVVEQRGYALTDYVLRKKVNVEQ